MALSNFGKRKEEKKAPACACSCGCPTSEVEDIKSDCCGEAVKDISMSRRLIKGISLFLALVIALQATGIMEIAAYAEDFSDAAAIETMAEPEVSGEDITKREESVKHFRLSDGSFAAISYGVPVHYQDEDGSWQDINNVPVMTADASGRESYQISNGDSAAAFSSTLSEGHLLTASYGERSVSMSLLDMAQALALTEEGPVSAAAAVADSDGFTYSRNAVAQLEGNEAAVMALSTETSSQEEDFIPDNLLSSVIYENVYPGVDIRYTVWSYTIKEEIIVNTLQEAYRFDFFLALKELSARQNDDGSVSLLDSENTEIYYIPAPYMVDAAGTVSDLVSYELTVVEDGVVLTVEADKNWIESGERTLPISIDPSVSTSILSPSNTASDDVYTTYVHPGYPASALYTSDQLYTGFHGSYPSAPYVTYLYFNNIPEVPVGSIISEVDVRMYLIKYSNGGCGTMPIGVYPVTDNLPSDQTVHSWFTQINYNNKPAYNADHAVDYLYTSASSAASFLSWDITELAREWYAGNGNRMVALAAVGTYGASNTAWQLFSKSAYNESPIMKVVYRNSFGLEDYYTYQSMGVGEAGTAYIADATGQLKIVKNLLGYSSGVNPFSLNLVYNSDYFMDSTENYIPPSEMGLDMDLGAGWTIDFVQSITQSADSIYYLEHRDGDGTIHYYKRNDSTSSYYYDEDGLGLYIAWLGADMYRLDDSLGGYLLFDNNVLTEIKDSDGNRIYVKYTDNRITSITQENRDGTELTLAALSYSGNVLTSVTDAAGNVYTLNYSDGKLTAIRKNDTVTAQFGYSGCRVNKMTDNESGYALNVTYNALGMVSGYNETVGTTVGAAVTVTYPNQGQVTYRDHGVDRTAGTSDDLLYNYLFDYAGRTINAYVSDDGQNIYGASNAVYSLSNSTDKRTNRILRSASTGAVAQQLLRDTGFESGSWTVSGTSVSTEKPRTGTKSLTGSTGSASDSQYAQIASESLAANQTYTFSGYVNTSGMTFSGKGLYLKVTDSSGNVWTGDPVAYATSASVDSGWTRVSVTFTAKTAGAHTAAICREGAAGTFYADDFQLERGAAPSAYNMVENGNLLSGSGWTLGTGASVTDGTLKISSAPGTEDAAAYQDIPVNLPGGQTYVLSGWAKADAVPNDQAAAVGTETDTYKQFALRAILTYADGATEIHSIPFETDVTAWQFVSYALIPQEPAKTVSSIRVVCAYEENLREAVFDNISLVQEVAQTMTYDDNGNLLCVTSTGQAADVNSYSAYNLLVKRETAGSGTYYYTYANGYNSYRVSSMTNTLITETYGHDPMGNLQSTTISGSGSKTIVTSSTYSSDGNRLASVTDAAGATVTYAYGTADSLMTGLPTSVTDPNGTVTNTTYDSFNRITQTGIANTAELLYNYSNGYLGSVSRTGDTGTQSYNFSYDAFGNMTELKVGSRSLATYTYGESNGLLLSQSYANGDIVSFTYDHLGRAKTITYPDGTLVTYAYTGDGALYSVTAEKDGAQTRYIYGYDSLGRLISSEWKDNGASVLRTRQGYDDTNRLVTQSWQLGGDVYTEGFTYNSTQDGSLNTHTTATGQTLTMGYDELRRLSTITGGIYGKTYTYRDISDTKTTTQVASVVYDLPTDLTYGYTYDILGNIATYTDASGTVTYTYDTQGQLLSATNGSTTYSYTYDTVGNILTANGHTYTYGDSVWKDLLTAYDGQSITYDASGNPTSYYNGTRWTFGWTNGRRLATATNGTTNLSYTYDTDGLRTSKTVDGVKHSYLYAGGKLLRETYGNNTLDFFYDNAGSPYALKYNGTTYYYITNLQGDVMHLVNADGTVVASYEYDPYGNITSSSGDLAAVNPLRYRGYYYDTDSGLYYLQSRYYDPKVGRFINADSYASTGQGILGNNMFAYCKNNAVLLADFFGYAPFPTTTAMSDGRSGLSLEGLLGSYNELRNLTAGNPTYEVHHLVEKRFYNVPGVRAFKNDPNNAPSVILKKETHRTYTANARATFPYGSNYQQMSATTIRSYYTAEYGGKLDWLDFICSCFE